MSVSALAGILRRKGFDVFIAHTLAEGFDLLSQQPEWIVLDLMLPDGDGTDLLRHVRDQNLPAKILVVTAVNDLARLQQVNQLQPDNLMRKPLDLPGLLRQLELKQ